MLGSGLPLDTPFGAVYEIFDVNEGNLPGHGGDDVFRNAQYLIPGFPPLGGDSYVAIVEFTPSGARARNLIGYGNASQGPHAGDQWAMFARKELRDVLRDRPSIEARLERRDVLEYTARAA